MKEVGEHRGVRTWGEKVGDLFREKKRINSNIDMGEEGKERPYMGEDEVAGSKVAMLAGSIYDRVDGI